MSQLTRSCLHNVSTYLLSRLGYRHGRHSHSKILIEWIYPTPGALEHLFYLSLGWNHVSTRFEATIRACLLMFDDFFWNLPNISSFQKNGPNPFSETHLSKQPNPPFMTETDGTITPSLEAGSMPNWQRKPGAVWVKHELPVVSLVR